MSHSRWSADSLDAVHDQIWQRWQKAIGSSDDQLRLGVLATRSDGGVSQRMLVLRGCDRKAGTIMSFTDLRSPKVAEIGSCPEVSWLFYDWPSKVQIRVEGAISLHTDDRLADECWAQVPPSSKLNYLGVLPPSSETDSPTSNLPPDAESLLTGGPERLAAAPGQFLDAGRQNFGVLATSLRRIDWLWLRETAHVRCRFDLDEVTREPRGVWVTP